MARQANRRGVQTVGVYLDVTPETKAMLDRIAKATGSRKNALVEQIVHHVPLDEAGVPVWWEEPLPQALELEMRAS